MTLMSGLLGRRTEQKKEELNWKGGEWADPERGHRGCGRTREAGESATIATWRAHVVRRMPLLSRTRCAASPAPEKYTRESSQHSGSSLIIDNHLIL